MLKKIVFGLSFFLIIPSQVWAWGSKGHKLVAQIAEKCLDKSVIDSVQKYLGDLSFEEAAVWMDEVRSDQAYNYLKPWHYVNVDKDKTYVKTKDPDIINEIEIAIAALNEKEERDKNKINFALKILFHLVGDIHQPLHCGYSQDKGGNTFQTQLFGKGTNLHKVWDSEIIEETGITLTDCLKMANTLTAMEKNKIQTNDIVIWMNESRELLPNVYNGGEKITKDYLDKNKLVIEKQLVKAGIRLAMVLQKAFKK